MQEWLPKDSERLWRGSYKGKDWRYLVGPCQLPERHPLSHRCLRGISRCKFSVLHLLCLKLNSTCWQVICCMARQLKMLQAVCDGCQ